ncbi:MAG: spore coat protein [Clostridia bacterium]|nr:spore coat protein [Clostridia bacterium]
MDEKTMINDILEGVKTELTTYGQAISESENMQLRNTLQQIRNSSESFQYELFKIAQTKGYYKPAEKVNEEQIVKVKNDLEA